MYLYIVKDIFVFIQAISIKHSNIPNAFCQIWYTVIALVCLRCRAKRVFQAKKVNQWLKTAGEC